MQGEIEWSILDVEEEEWNRRVAGVDVAAAANGFPVAAPPTPAHAKAGYAAPSAGRIREHWRALALGAAGAALVLAVLGYALWRAAEDGIARAEAEVAGQVKLENLKTREHFAYTAIADGVESIELNGDAALVESVITYTKPSGEIGALRQLGFYARTATGWQRTEPLPAFWGHSSTLDTANLHFVFGERDRAAVEQVAPAAEALYTKLVEATGEKLTASGPVTVEVVTGRVSGIVKFVAGSVRVTSPLLYASTVAARSKKQVFLLLLSDGLCEPLMAAAIHKTPVKPQWTPLLDGLDCWRLGPAIDRQVASATWIGANVSLPASVKLSNLLEKSSANGSGQAYLAAGVASAPMQPSLYVPGGMHFDRSLFAANLVRFVAAKYGLAALPRLLHGMGEYDDWQSLVPAVFGVSAAELEAEWHAARGATSPAR